MTKKKAKAKPDTDEQAMPGGWGNTDTPITSPMPGDHNQDTPLVQPFPEDFNQDTPLYQEQPHGLGGSQSGTPAEPKSAGSTRGTAASG